LRLVESEKKTRKGVAKNDVSMLETS